jgi:hypothetical protein
MTGHSVLVDRSEVVSYRGNAISVSGTRGLVNNSYIHDSNNLISSTGSGFTIANSILAAPVNAAINSSGSGADGMFILNCTLVGWPSSLAATGVSVASGSSAPRMDRSIVYGFSTGFNNADSGETNYYGTYNLFNNNTTNGTNYTLSSTAKTTAPVFKDVTEVSFSNGTVSGSVVTSSGADFSGVTDNQDYLWLVSGTAGPTFGIYLITGHTSTTLTVDIAPGNNATADHVGRILRGRNFAPGLNVMLSGEQFAGGAISTTTYYDIGGAQRRPGLPKGRGR